VLWPKATGEAIPHDQRRSVYKSKLTVCRLMRPLAGHADQWNRRALDGQVAAAA
jgi:hypothetical protein